MQFCCDALKDLTEHDYSRTTKATASSPLKLFVEHYLKHHTSGGAGDEVASQATATTKWFTLTTAQKEPFLEIHTKQSSRARSKTASEGTKQSHINGFILFSSDARKTKKDEIKRRLTALMAEADNSSLTVLGATAKIMSAMWTELKDEGQALWKEKAKSVRETAKESTEPAPPKEPKRPRKKTTQARKRARVTKKQQAAKDDNPDRMIELTEDAISKAVIWKKPAPRKEADDIAMFNETEAPGGFSDED